MKKSIELLKTKLETKLRGKVKAFYIGDPWILPESSMPCIMLNPISTESNVLDNQRDSHTHNIDVSLVIDARQYFDATPDKMVGTVFLMDTMEAELSSGGIDPASILGVLRDNLDLGTNRNIKNISSIDYTVRRRTEDLITLEVVAHLQIEYLISR
ncbi:MAG: hypothetical protein WC346_09600 [Methanogenium sp.]|jgi:hypothetical protein